MTGTDVLAYLASMRDHFDGKKAQEERLAIFGSTFWEFGFKKPDLWLQFFFLFYFRRKSFFLPQAGPDYLVEHLLQAGKCDPEHHQVELYREGLLSAANFPS